MHKEDHKATDEPVRPPPEVKSSQVIFYLVGQTKSLPEREPFSATGTLEPMVSAEPGGLLEAWAAWGS